MTYDKTYDKYLSVTSHFVITVAPDAPCNNSLSHFVITL